MGQAAAVPCPKQNCCKTGPTPIFLPLHQTFLHWVQVHVLEARREFRLVSYKAIPILMLPQGPMGAPPRVQPQRHKSFWRRAAPARSATDTAAKSARVSGEASKHNRRVESRAVAAKPPIRSGANRIQIR